MTVATGDPATLQMLALALLALVVALTIAWVATQMRATATRRRRLARAAWAEDAAAALLRDQGWEILEAQPSCVWSMEIDGRPLEVTSRADLLARRDGRLVVVDAKSGDRAPNPALPVTRRQLLEYALSFGVDGVLLVDAERMRVVEVGFESLLRGHHCARSNG